MRRLQRYCRRSRGGGMRHAAVVGRGQGHHDHRRVGKRGKAASAAACVYRRASPAVRLLRFRYLDECRGTFDAESQSHRQGREGGARPQSLPLRIPQPHGAGGAARRGRDGGPMTTPAPSPSVPKLPVSLAANPVLSSWVRFSPEGRVRVSPGKVEIGQGIVTALAQIAADELDVDIGRVQMVRASTAASPNEGVTSGSLSVQQSGRAIRHACAEIRQIFLDAASDRLGVGIDALDVKDGTISGPGNVSTSYWELAVEVSLDRDAKAGATPKPSAQRPLAGSSIQRVDIPDKVFGHRRFIHDFALPGMLHGRVLRPELAAAKLVNLSEDRARAVAGLVAIVRDGNFVGALSETEDGAENALRALRKDATWSSGETLPDEDRLAEWLKAQPSEPTVIDTKTASGKRPKARTIRRQYTRPYLAHASIAPSSRWCSNCRSKRLSSNIWRAPAATGITPPTTWRLMRFCLRKPPAAGRSGCNGRATTICHMRHSARRWRSKSKPILTPKARSSNGDTASGAMAIRRGPDARRSLLCLRRPNWRIPFRATSPPIRHRPMAVAPIATRYHSTIFHRGKSNAIGCLPCRYARPR